MMKYLFVGLVEIMGLGMIGEKDKDKGKRLTVGFAVSAVILAIMMTN